MFIERTSKSSASLVVSKEEDMTFPSPLDTKLADDFGVLSMNIVYGITRSKNTNGYCEKVGKNYSFSKSFDKKQFFSKKIFSPLFFFCDFIELLTRSCRIPPHDLEYVIAYAVPVEQKHKCPL